MNFLKANRLFLLLHIVFFVSCDENNNTTQNSATAGNVKVLADESFRPLFSIMEYTFETLYSKADISLSYQPQGSLVSALVNDSCKMIISGRDLDSVDIKSLAAKNLFPVRVKVADNATAIITNIENPLDSLTLAQLYNILTGKNDNDTKVIFDNNQSTNTLYITDSLLKGAPFSAANVFAVSSTEELINRIEKSNNTIGVLNFNWISDKDDRKAQEILKKVKVLAIAKDSTQRAFLPCQAFIRTKEYPLTLAIYMINRQKVGLGTGFVNFVAGKEGQLMILKAGLVPAFPPERIIQVKTK